MLGDIRYEKACYGIPHSCRKNPDEDYQNLASKYRPDGQYNP